MAGGKEARRRISRVFLAGAASERGDRHSRGGERVFFNQGVDMGGTLNLSTLVVAPSMTGEDVLVVDNAHLVEISEHGELAPHVGMGDGIIIQIETDIRCLAGGDGHPLAQLLGVAE
jgi:hypothetical protein